MTETESTQEPPHVSVSRLFGVMAPSLGWVPSPRFLLRRNRVLRMIGDCPPGKVLEVGCGAGALLHEMAERNQEAVGIETSERARSIAVSIAQHGSGKQVVVDRPGETWGEAYDLVCAFDVLEHIEDDVGALQQWLTWLRPGGYLCVSVPAHRSRWGPGDKWAGHWRRYDRRDIESLVRSTGLVMERMECYGFPLGNLTELYGKNYYRRMLAEKGTGASKSSATSQSGVDRDYYLNRFHKIDSFIGRGALRTAFALQSIASTTDWGSGYLLLAKKK